MRVDFDRRLKLEFHGSKITSGAGLLVYREFDDSVGLTDSAADVFNHNRTGKNAIKWTRLSCRKFRSNEARLRLHVLAVMSLSNWPRWPSHETCSSKSWT